MNRSCDDVFYVQLINQLAICSFHLLIQITDLIRDLDHMIFVQKITDLDQKYIFILFDGKTHGNHIVIVAMRT